LRCKNSSIGGVKREISQEDIIHVDRLINSWI